MQKLTTLLLSLVFIIGVGKSIKPPYPDPLEKEKFGVQSPTPVSDTDNIPARVKTPRTSKQRPGLGTVGDSQSPASSGQGSDTLLAESPKAKGKQPGSGVDSTNSGSTNSGSIPADTDDNSRKLPSRVSVPAAPSSQVSPKPPATSDADNSRQKLPSANTFGPSNPGTPSFQLSPNPPATGGTTTGGSTPYTCDSLPPGADKVSLSCFDQRKLKDYCTQAFGGASRPVQVLGRTHSGFKRYVVDTTIQANWYQALGICQTRNMSLATVESYDEQKALSLVLNEARGVQNAWLSGNDLGQINSYIWMTTGQPLTYTNWFDGEPNHKNSGNETEHCIEVINYRWRWNDNLCDNKEYFVCQYYSDN